LRRLITTDIDLVQSRGHAGGSEVTETVYRKQIRPVLLDGAEATERLFPGFAQFTLRLSIP
jgi:hypothetical protein